jgi:hypothetical protein
MPVTRNASAPDADGVIADRGQGIIQDKKRVMTAYGAESRLVAEEVRGPGEFEKGGEAHGSSK